MKDIPILVLDSLKKSGRSTCFLIKIVSVQDGRVYTFTTLDAAIKFNDGEHDVWYMPTNFLTPQNMQWSADMEVDNTELHGWFDAVVQQAVDAGLLGSAEVTIYRLIYTHPEYGAELINFGVVAGMAFSANAQGARKIGFKGLDHLLKTKKNPLYSITCRNDFGDERCGKSFTWDPGTITEVSNQYLLVKVGDIAAAPGFYNFGVVKFTSGDNTDVELEIEEWLTGGWARLSFVTPYPMQVGDGVMFRQDCDKFAQTCITVYSNIINFNGEHLTPVQDQSLMVPGAYIKSQNAL